MATIVDVLCVFDKRLPKTPPTLIFWVSVSEENSIDPAATNPVNSSSKIRVSPMLLRSTVCKFLAIS